MQITVKSNNQTIVEHEISTFSTNNGYASAFLTGGLIPLSLSIGDFVEVLIDDEGTAVADLLATFESYQFSMGTYPKEVDGEMVTEMGVTNNSLVFKILQIRSV